MQPNVSTSPLTASLAALRRNAARLLIVAGVFALLAGVWLVVFNSEQTMNSSIIIFDDPAKVEAVEDLPENVLPTYQSKTEVAQVQAQTDRDLIERDSVSILSRDETIKVTAIVDDPESDTVNVVIENYRKGQMANLLTVLDAAAAARDASVERLESEAKALEGARLDSEAGSVAREAVILRQVELDAAIQELRNDSGALEAYASRNPDGIDRVIVEQPQQTGGTNDDAQRVVLVFLVVILLGGVVVVASSILRQFNDDSSTA